MNFKILVCLLLLCVIFSGNLYAQSKTAAKHTGGAAASVARGKIVYQNICVACHMADGKGVPTMNPPIVNTSYVLGDKAALIKIVLNGFNEDVEINGQKFSNNMTPHADLKDRQIADVLTYVRKSFGNKASSVSVAEVKKVRTANTK